MRRRGIDWLAVRGAVGLVATVAFLVGVVWLFIATGQFNDSQARKCEAIGMTWVTPAHMFSNERPGCAVIQPIPDGEES